MNFLFYERFGHGDVTNLLQFSRPLSPMTILFLSVTFLYTYLGIQKIFLYFCESAILLSKINQTLL
ncbi:hypothetical protein SAMN02910322_01766 [Bacteroides thetaiotaomicron]|nr:hypothetical protein SAMN02910322_01766 [Bacteroides thetaiotaomicron]